MAKGSGGGGRSGGGGAREQVLAYASKYNTYGPAGYGHVGGGLTNEEFIGKAASGGVVISRSPAGKVIATVSRSGGKIIITETTVTRDPMTDKEIRTSKVVKTIKQ